MVVLQRCLSEGRSVLFSERGKIVGFYTRYEEEIKQADKELANEAIAAIERKCPGCGGTRFDECVVENDMGWRIPTGRCACGAEWEVTW